MQLLAFIDGCVGVIRITRCVFVCILQSPPPPPTLLPLLLSSFVPCFLIFFQLPFLLSFRRLFPSFNPSFTPSFVHLFHDQFIRYDIISFIYLKKKQSSIQPCIPPCIRQLFLSIAPPFLCPFSLHKMPPFQSLLAHSLSLF